MLHHSSTETNRSFLTLLAIASIETSSTDAVSARGLFIPNWVVDAEYEHWLLVNLIRGGDSISWLAGSMIIRVPDLSSPATNATRAFLDSFFVSLGWSTTPLPLSFASMRDWSLPSPSSSRLAVYLVLAITDDRSNKCSTGNHLQRLGCNPLVLSNDRLWLKHSKQTSNWTNRTLQDWNQLILIMKKGINYSNSLYKQ